LAAIVARHGGEYLVRGDTKGAEPVVDAALERDPTNYFAHHVKAHVLDTDCRAREGNHWLAAQVVHWSLGNNLIHHLWWHRTLLQLDLGERDAVLASYDENIRNFDDPMTKATPDHYVDLQKPARAVAAGSAGSMSASLGRTGHEAGRVRQAGHRWCRT
jgi:hypothetical protein